MSNRIKFIIYMLVDPRTGDPRYVGKSCYGLGRPRRHAVLTAVEDSAKARWIRELVSLGLMYKIVVLEESFSHGALVAAEERWLLAGKRLSWPLTNAEKTWGGCWKMSPEARAKISAAKRGKPRPDLIGKPRPDLAALNSSRPKGKEERAKLAAAATGNKRGAGFKMTAKHRKTMSDLRKQEWAPNGWRRTDSPDGLRRKQK